MELEALIVSNRLGELAAQLHTGAAEIVEETTLDIVDDATVNVKKVTGNLARTIHAEQVSALEWSAGTDSEYGRRIEFGFVGADSLGRVYDQAGQPYLTPAAEKARPEFERKMRDLLQ